MRPELQRLQAEIRQLDSEELRTLFETLPEPDRYALLESLAGSEYSKLPVSTRLQWLAEEVKRQFSL